MENLEKGVEYKLHSLFIYLTITSATRGALARSGG